MLIDDSDEGKFNDKEELIDCALPTNEKEAKGTAYKFITENIAEGPQDTVSTEYKPAPKTIISKAPTTVLTEKPKGAFNIVSAVLSGKLKANEENEGAPISAELNPWETKTEALGMLGNKEEPIDSKGPDNVKDQEFANKPTRLNNPEIPV